MSGWSEVFVNVLMNEGIPATAQTRTGYFATAEVETVLSLLSVIDNPMQDIPMAAVLRSPMIGMNDNEMAWMMAAYKRYTEKNQDRGVYAAEEIFKTGDNAALDAYLHEYEVYAEDGYEKYTERVDIYDRYSHFIEDVMDLREKSDWESDKTPRAYEVEDILYYAHEILLQDDYRISEIEFQENQKYFSEIQQNTIATLMGTLEMTEEEVNEFVKCDRYYDEEETFVKIIFERKGWEYEEN